MKITSLVALSFALAALASLGRGAELGAIPNGAAFRSPNGRFTVSVKFENLTIKDNQTGEVFPPVQVLTPLYVLQWASDSQSLVTVEHIAGGTTAGIIHYTNGSWLNRSASPDNDPPFKQYEIVSLIPQPPGIRLTYECTLRSGSGNRYYTYSFNINPQSAERSAVTKQEITKSRFASLKRKWLEAKRNAP